MKLVYKIIFTVLMLPGIILIWILIAAFTSSRFGSVPMSDYFSYLLPHDLGMTAMWSFPLALFIAFIILIFIWSSGKGKQKTTVNPKGNYTQEKRKGRSSGEYQDGNPYA